MKKILRLLFSLLIPILFFLSGYGQQTHTDSISNLFDTELEDLLEMEIQHTAASNIE